MKNLIFAYAFLLLTIPCSAEIIIVDNEWPYDFNNIQAAIDYSSNGDFIIVFPGRYTGPGNRDIDFLGKSVTVRSIVPTDPYFVAETIIDCNGIGRGFNFISGEDANSVLAGFTITNGAQTNGGGIYCYESSPKITNCIISGNSANDEGGGICCYYYNYYNYSALKVTNCSISGNTANRGGGIYCVSSSPIITSCTITGNSAEDNGGGICCDYIWNTKVTNCTIVGNSAKGNGGGICLTSSSWIYVTSSIVWGNADISGQGQSSQVYGVTPNVWFSCIQNYNPNDVNIPLGENKWNIDDDPCFVEPGFWDANSLWHDGDYHLLAASPCIETGDPYFTYHAGDIDMDGQPRLMGRRVDMGADEVEIAMIVITKPQGGEVWASGSSHEINWDSYGITGTVNISYSTNNGADWAMIENGVTNTGSFTWHLPEAVDSSQCLVSVKPNVPVSNLISTPSGLFTIHSSPAGPPVASKWKSLGGNFSRTGLSQNYGPQLGCVKWQFQTDGPVSASPTVGPAGRVHLACEDGNLYTLDANGQLLWSYDTNSPLLSAPTIGRDGSVFVGAENGTLYAIDVNGNLRWTHCTDGFIYSSPAVSPDGNVFVCSQDGTLYALGRNGSELWTFETAGAGPVTTGAIFASSAIGHDGTIYIAGLYDPNLYALDPNTGSVKWRCSFSGLYDPNNKRPWTFVSPVIAADGTIYISQIFDPNLYAVNPNNGNIIWSVNLADPCYPYKYVWSEPALGPDGTIYVNLNDPYLRAVNPNGTIKWVARLGVMGGFTLTIGSNGLIYAASDDAYLCVIDPDGKEIARFKGNDWLSFPVITANNTMIICDENNTVWAIGGSGCEGQAAALHKPQDLSADWAVNFKDFALVANDWLKPNCFASDELPPCEEQDGGYYFTGDIDRDLYVDFIDLAELADEWLSQE